MKRRIPAGSGYSHPERVVVRTGVSPMNPKVKWAELSCGHDVYRLRRPRIGATVVCDKCAGVSQIEAVAPPAREEDTWHPSHRQGPLGCNACGCGYRHPARAKPCPYA